MKKINLSTGTPTLLVIFVVVFLLIFGTLTIQQVKSESHLASLNLNSEIDYYKAEGENEAILAKVDKRILDARHTQWKNGGMFHDLLAKSCNDEVKLVSEGPIDYLEWTVKFENGGEIQEKIMPYQTGVKHYDILKHVVINHKEWNGDDRHLEVFGG